MISKHRPAKSPVIFIEVFGPGCFQFNRFCPSSDSRLIFIILIKIFPIDFSLSPYIGRSLSLSGRMSRNAGYMSLPTSLRHLEMKRSMMFRRISWGETPEGRWGVRGFLADGGPIGLLIFSFKGLKRLRNKSWKGGVPEWLTGRLGYLWKINQWSFCSDVLVKSLFSFETFVVNRWDINVVFIDTAHPYASTSSTNQIGMTKRFLLNASCFNRILLRFFDQ